MIARNSLLKILLHFLKTWCSHVLKVWVLFLTTLPITIILPKYPIFVRFKKTSIKSKRFVFHNLGTDLPLPEKDWKDLANRIEELITH